MITPDDITEDMVEELHDARVLGEDWEADDIPNLMAVCVNAYLATNPACAAGEELLAVCRSMVGYLAQFNDEDMMPEFCLHRDAMIQLVETIAKAKGATP